MKHFTKWICTVCAIAVLLSGCAQSAAQSGTAQVTGSSLAVTIDSNTPTTVTENYDYAKKALDASYDASAQEINLSAQSGTVKIAKAGEYIITGTLSDGGIEIDADDDVQLILSGANITNTSGAAITALNGDVIITLADATENSITASNLADDANGAIYASDDLYFNGNGTLTVTSDGDAIAGKDDVAFISGTYNINAGDDGIRGKDAIAIKDGVFKITSAGDGLKSTNDTDAALGCIYIDGGTLDITAGGDGIQAYTSLYVADGTIDIVTNGGSANAAAHTQANAFGGGMGGGRMFDGTVPSDRQANTPPDMTAGATTISDASQAQTTDMQTLSVTNAAVQTETITDETTDSFKGFKAGTSIIISGGMITVDTADDSIHTNGICEISGGTFTLTSGDDGIHADDTLSITNGNITVVNSYEALEAATINISGGEIDVTATDDGINAAGGTDTQNGQTDSFARSTGTLNITGGTLTVNAAGDGLDANGTMNISGGFTVVYGPENSGNGALDYDGSCTVSGGTLIALGASGMSQMPSECTNQACLSVAFTQTQAAGTELSLKNSNGDIIFTVTSEKTFSSAVITTPDMSVGEVYTLYANGTEVVTTTLTDALASISDTGAAVQSGMSGNMGGGRGGMGGFDASNGTRPERQQFATN